MNKKHAVIFFMILSVMITGMFVYAADVLSIDNTYLARGNIGSEYTDLSGEPMRLSASGGSGAGYTFSLVSGTLPKGLNIDTDGTIRGIPEESGIYGNLVFQVRDSDGAVASSRKLTMAINSKYIDFTIKDNKFVYDGKPHLATVSCSDDTLREGRDYQVLYSGKTESPKSVGGYSISIRMLRSGYLVRSVNPNVLNITPNYSCSIRLDSQTVPYDGTPKELVPTVSPAGLSYTVSYRQDGSGVTTTQPPTDAGTYQVTAEISEAGYFAEPVYARLNIVSETIDFTVTESSAVYDGTPHQVVVVPNTSVPANSYDVTYDDQKTADVEENDSFVTNAGEYQIKIRFNTQQYKTGKISPNTFVIEPASVNFTVVDTEPVYQEGKTFRADVSCDISEFSKFTVLYEKEGIVYENEVTAPGIYGVSVRSDDSNYQIGKVEGSQLTVRMPQTVDFTINETRQEYDPNRTTYGAVITPSIEGFRDFQVIYRKDGSDFVGDIPSFLPGTYAIDINLTNDIQYVIGKIEGEKTITLVKRPIDFTITGNRATQSAVQTEYGATVTPSIEEFTDYTVWYEVVGDGDAGDIPAGITFSAVTAPGVYAIHIELTEEGKKNNQMREISPAGANFTLAEDTSDPGPGPGPGPDPDTPRFTIALDYGNSPYGRIMAMNWADEKKDSAKQSFAATRQFAAGEVPWGYRSEPVYSQEAWDGEEDPDLDETAAFVYGGTDGFTEPGYTVKDASGAAVSTGEVTVTFKRLAAENQGAQDVTVGTAEWNTLSGRRIMPGIYTVEYEYHTDSDAGTTPQAVTATRTVVFLDRLGDANGDGNINGIDAGLLRKNLANGSCGGNSLRQYRVFDANRDGSVDAEDVAAIMNRMNVPLTEFYPCKLEPAAEAFDLLLLEEELAEFIGEGEDAFDGPVIETGISGPGIEESSSTESAVDVPGAGDPGISGPAIDAPECAGPAEDHSENRGPAEEQKPEIVLPEEPAGTEPEEPAGTGPEEITGTEPMGTESGTEIGTGSETGPETSTEAGLPAE